MRSDRDNVCALKLALRCPLSRTREDFDERFGVAPPRPSRSGIAPTPAAQSTAASGGKGARGLGRGPGGVTRCRDPAVLALTTAHLRPRRHRAFVTDAERGVRSVEGP